MSSGLDQSAMLATAPPKSLPMIPELCSDHVDEMSLCSLSMTPSLLLNFTFPSTATAGYLLSRWAVNPKWLPYDYTGITSASPFPAYVHPTVLSKAAVPFQFWRGSMRYKLYFYCTSFHTARLAITFTPLIGMQDPSIPTSEPIVDNLTRLVDIAGDTEVDLDLPFMFPNLYAAHSIGTLTVAVITPIAEIGAVTSVPIYCSVYVAAGSDIIYKQLTNDMLIPKTVFSNTDPAPPSLEPHSDPRADFRTAFDPIYGKSMSATITDPSFHDSFASVADVIHQPTLHGLDVASPYGHVAFTGTPSTARQYSFSTIDWTKYAVATVSDTLQTIYGSAMWAFPVSISGYQSAVTGACQRPNGTYFIPPSIHFADSYKFSRGGYRVKALNNSNESMRYAVLRNPRDIWYPQTGALGTPFQQPFPYLAPAVVPGSTAYLSSPPLPDYLLAPTTSILGLDSVSEIEVPMNTAALFRTTGTAYYPTGLASNGAPPDTVADWVMMSTGTAPSVLIKSLYVAMADGFRFYYIKGSKSSYRVRGGQVYSPALYSGTTAYYDPEGQCPIY